jgi:hypothetical protein
LTLKHDTEGNTEGKLEVTEDEKEDESRYRMTLRKRENTGN